MSELSCFSCGAKVTNGLALCDLCQMKAKRIAEYLPIHYRNLARWRPGRAGARPVPGSRVLYDGTVRGTGTGDKISDALDETYNMLGTRARELSDDRPYVGRLLDRLSNAREAEAITEAEAVEWLCRGIVRFLTSISTLDWCGDLVMDLDQAEGRLSNLSQRYVPGWYAGGCQQLAGIDEEGDVFRCGADLYVMPGLTWITCGTCGATSHAPDHIETVLHEARGWVARPKQIAEAVVALVYTEESVPKLYTRIRQWAFNGQIEPIHHTARGYGWDEASKRMIVVDEDSGRARYRMGEVLDRVLAKDVAAKRARAS